ncbi:hypothetical protein PR202_ga04777 [Eleusine coracana subsp. coracana]|uniref:Transmembrane protein n=1 Tax=Eleusine coracana subsp. coracana TaxID=191504 RepID=A0AAV5BSE7_ELECO|nr:hypothetical protein PR202_ga04777 [Eleusine coracana subsp. coracana]
MDKTVIIVSAVVGSLGVLSAVLGFIGEGANLYNQSPALGIVACIFLLAGQITVSAVGGCCGCCKSRAIPSETNRIVGVICAVVSWILAVIAMALLFRAAWLNSIGYYLSGLYAGGGVLALLATALGITSFIMLRSQSPAADVEVVAVSASNRPSVQQSPMAFLQVGQPQFSPVGVASAPSMPDVQPVPGGVAMGHPMSSPGAVAVATNNQEFKQQPLPEVVPIGHHPQSQPVVAAQGTVIMPREQPPLHTVGTMSLPQQVPQPQNVMQQQPPHLPVEPGASAGDLRRRRLTAVGPNHGLGVGWRCCGCCKPSSRAVSSDIKRIISIVCAILSWVAWVLLLNGAAWNANMTRQTAPNCFHLTDGVFAGVAVPPLAATALGVTSYIMLRSQPEASMGTPNNKPHEPAAIATGHPQLPTPQGVLA